MSKPSASAGKRAAKTAVLDYIDQHFPEFRNCEIAIAVIGVTDGHFIDAKLVLRKQRGRA